MSSLISPTASDFSTEEIRALEEETLFLDTTQPTKRKVSAALFSPPSSISSSSSASYTASIRTQGFNFDLSQHFDIPLAARSADALEFIGLTTSTAVEIFDKWNGRPNPDQNPSDLIDYVSSHVTRLNSRQFESLSNHQALERLGLQPKTCAAILDPRFTQLLETETLDFWVKDTLRTNYKTLLRLQKRLKDHAANTISKKKKPKRGSVQNVFDQRVPVRQGAQLVTGQPTPPQARSESITINMTSKDYNLPEAHVALDAEGPILPDHVVLYKGKASSEMQDQLIQDDGSIDMSVLSTRPGGDFNPLSVAWYWTPEKETAEQYRQFAAIRCDYSETWLIRIQIPETFFSGLRIADLYYGRDWKEFVWYCKKQRVPPEKFNRYWRNPGGVDLIKGHICTGVTTKIARIKQEDVQTTISDSNVLKLRDGRTKAKQWVFPQIDSVERLAMVVRGKMHIDVCAASGPGKN